MERVFRCDPAKRALLLKERNFDLLEMAAVFDDENRLEFIDIRKDYGEERRVAIGGVGDAIFTIVYTMRDQITWLITAWPANRKERERYANR